MEASIEIPFDLPRSIRAGVGIVKLLTCGLFRRLLQSDRGQGQA